MKLKKSNLYVLVPTALMAALASVLMFVSVSLPFLPSYLKLDISELPALLTAFVLGPAAGAMVCLVKNLVNLLFTQTGGVGELINLLLSLALVVPAGFLYRRRPTRGGALLSGAAGAACMAALSLPLNYFIIYPIYFRLMSREAVMGMYRAILPWADTLFKALLTFNVPLTLGKALLDTVLIFVLYRPLAPVFERRLPGLRPAGRKKHTPLS